MSKLLKMSPAQALKLAKEYLRHQSRYNELEEKVNNLLKKKVIQVNDMLDYEELANLRNLAGNSIHYTREELLNFLSVPYRWVYLGDNIYIAKSADIDHYLYVEKVSREQDLPPIHRGVDHNY